MLRILNQPLPFGSRTGLSDPKGIGTPLPNSKVIGDPSAILRASEPVRIARVVNPLDPFRPRELGAFEKTFDGREPALWGSDQNRSQARLSAEDAARRLRLAAAPTAVPDFSKPTGWDWIKHGRTILPNVPGKIRGLVAVTRSSKFRGVSAGQLSVPILTTETLAAEGAKADLTGPRVALPMSEPMTIQLQPAEPAKTLQASEGGPSGAMQFVMIAAAVIVVFLIVRG